MTSTFHGLETAKRSLQTQQAGLYTTGNNVANANTPGYTRQRINMSATEAYPAASLNRPQMPGQIGTGVTAGAIQRIRESFLDTQYRKENAKLGYYSTNADALAKLENILNETGKESSGIGRVLNDFWQSLQDLYTNPENGGAKEVVIQRGHTVADTFNYIYGTIEEYREDLWSQMTADESTINATLKRLDELNKQIAEMEPLGFLPNNLYDERDLLVDELSAYMDIEVTFDKPSPDQLSDKKIAGMVEGTYIISVNGTQILNKDGYKELSIVREEDGDKNVTSLTFGGETIALPQGRLKSLVENYGTSDQKGTYSEMLDNIDKLAKDFMDQVNAAHKQGTIPDGEVADFFEGEGAKGMKVAITDASQLASSMTGSVGDGANAKNMADSFKDVLRDYEKLIGKLGVDAQFANRQQANVLALRESVDDKRLSVSTVSLDEEMMNMIKYQHAYNAAARSITAIDEMLDKIINGMGVVGR